MRVRGHWKEKMKKAIPLALRVNLASHMAKQALFDFKYSLHCEMVVVPCPLLEAK